MSFGSNLCQTIVFACSKASARKKAAELCFLLVVFFCIFWDSRGAVERELEPRSSVYRAFLISGGSFRFLFHDLGLEDFSFMISGASDTKTSGGESWTIFSFLFSGETISGLHGLPEVVEQSPPKLESLESHAAAKIA